jgi:hypothetical protein
MEDEHTKEAVGKPDEFWRRIYIAVIISDFVVVTALWAFTRYFSG